MKPGDLVLILRALKTQDSYRFYKHSKILPGQLWRMWNDFPDGSVAYDNAIEPVMLLGMEKVMYRSLCVAVLHPAHGFLLTVLSSKDTLVSYEQEVCTDETR